MEATGKLYKDGELIGLISNIEVMPALEFTDPKEDNVRYLSSKPVEFSAECEISKELIKALRIQEVMITYVIPSMKTFFVEPNRRGRQKLFLPKYIHGEMIYPTKIQTLTERFLSYDFKYDEEKYEVYRLVDSKKKYNKNKRIQKKWKKRTQIVRYILVEKEQMCGLDFDGDICTLIIKM